MRASLALGDSESSRPLLSLRALAVLVALLLAFAIVAPTARHAMQQAEQLRTTEAQIAEQRAAEQELREQMALWGDDTYVQAQARSRLGYILPGQTPYVVIDPETSVGTAPAGPTEAERRAQLVTATQPWFATVSEGIAGAGEAPVSGAETPVPGMVTPGE